MDGYDIWFVQCFQHLYEVHALGIEAIRGQIFFHLF
jgi:hypothetical protein